MQTSCKDVLTDSSWEAANATRDVCLGWRGSNPEASPSGKEPPWHARERWLRPRCGRVSSRRREGGSGIRAEVRDGRESEREAEVGLQGLRFLTRKVPAATLISAATRVTLHRMSETDRETPQQRRIEAHEGEAERRGIGTEEVNQWIEVERRSSNEEEMH